MPKITVSGGASNVHPVTGEVFQEEAGFQVIPDPAPGPADSPQDAPGGEAETAEPDTQDAGDIGTPGAPDDQLDPPEAPGEPYDPGAHTVPDVNAYLAGPISDDERARVLAVERAERNRKGIVGDGGTE